MYDSTCPHRSSQQPKQPSALTAAPCSHQHLAGQKPCSEPAVYHHVNVYRYDPQSDSEPRLDSFAVVMSSCGPMLLDVLLAIKNQVDSTLTLRRSCREGPLTADTEQPTVRRTVLLCSQMGCVVWVGRYMRQLFSQRQRRLHPVYCG